MSVMSYLNCHVHFYSLREYNTHSLLEISICHRTYECNFIIKVLNNSLIYNSYCEMYNIPLAHLKLDMASIIDLVVNDYKKGLISSLFAEWFICQK